MCLQEGAPSPETPAPEEGSHWRQEKGHWLGRDRMGSVRGRGPALPCQPWPRLREVCRPGTWQEGTLASSMDPGQTITSPVGPPGMRGGPQSPGLRGNDQAGPSLEAQLQALCPLGTWRWLRAGPERKGEARLLGERVGTRPPSDRHIPVATSGKCLRGGALSPGQRQEVLALLRRQPCLGVLR